MKVRNIAAHIPDGEEIEIPGAGPNGGSLFVIKGKPFEVPDELGLRLCEQTDAFAPSGETAKAAVEKAAD